MLSGEAGSPWSDRRGKLYGHGIFPCTASCDILPLNAWRWLRLSEQPARRSSSHNKTPSKGGRMQQAEHNTFYPLVLLDAIGEAVFVIDTQWRYTYVNKKAEELAGRPCAELLGSTIWGLFPETVAATFSAEMHRVVQQNTPTCIETYYPPLPNWFESRISPSAAGLVVLSPDITGRKQAEEALQRSEKLLRTLADTAPAIMWIAEPG